MSKRISRLCVLGELGRYPLLLTGIKHTLKYFWSIQNADPNSIIADSLAEMDTFTKQGGDCWLGKVEKMHSLLNIPKLPRYYKPKSVGKIISKRVSSKFDSYYLGEINKVKLDNNNQDRNKLRFYKSLKGTFSREPYLDLVHNRNQRAWLTRLRVSAHHLQIEVGRWSRPSIPPSERICRYCSDSSIDNEDHFLHDCATFALKHNCKPIVRPQSWSANL